MDVLTVRDVMKIFKVSRATVYRWNRKELISRHYLNSRIYYKLADIEKFMSEYRIEGRRGHHNKNAHTESDEELLQMAFAQKKSSEQYCHA